MKPKRSFETVVASYKSVGRKILEDKSSTNVPFNFVYAPLRRLKYIKCDCVRKDIEAYRSRDAPTV